MLLTGSIMDLSGKKILVGDLIDAINGNGKVLNGTSKDALEIMKIIDKVYK